ncbi:hypothetical protein LSH36_814g01042 [Paralvinella palmiformis]|uniref:Exosome complex component CSL4 n=1 Tax=Paralvinella palmiformis TaxID=53620 RepID=A0AAD9MS55_9ANNE|nr:hypothetical protein LSH36_814g01042 [Paralvinella palmiformis]
MSSSSVVIPGQRICKVEEEHIAGIGTYVRNGFINSSLLGIVTFTPNKEDKQEVTVAHEREHSLVPTLGSLVTARVTNLNQRFCKCSILNVDGTNLIEPYSGIVRKEDVRATDKDKVEMYSSFRPGDIILARVLTYGDLQSFLLTTGENELGVVMATSEAGGSLVPISWNEMQCSKTGNKEYRKVARVQPRNVVINDG